MSRFAQGPMPSQLYGVLEALTRPWTMDILSALTRNGPMRFGALRRKINGISCRMLTERLRLLERKKFVFRHFEPTIPPAVTYGLTSRVADIEKAFEALDRLSHKWHQEDTAAIADGMGTVAIALDTPPPSTRGSRYQQNLAQIDPA